MKKLPDFYANGNQLIKRLDESKNEVKIGSPLYQKAEVAEPIILKDDVALDLYRFITLLNGHFIPNRKPGIGLCTGEYVSHEGKDYIAGLLGVAYSNSLVLHMARNYEHTIEEWEKVKTETIEIFKKVSNFVQENSPEIFTKLKLEDNYYRDGVGFTSISTPSEGYLKKFEGVITEYTEKQQFPEIVEVCQKLVNDCKNFTSLGKSFDKMRDIADAKSVPQFKEDKITLNSPAASGGSSWFQTSSSEIIDSVPNTNNLFFYASHAGKLQNMNIMAIGGGSSVEKSITFIVPGDILPKIQEIVDKHSDLIQSWEKYKFNPTDTTEVSEKNSAEWKDLVNEKIKTEAIEIIRESINDEILGIQCDISECPEICYLRPVITETYAKKNTDLLKEKGVVEITPLYDKFLMDGGENYYLMN